MEIPYIAQHVSRVVQVHLANDLNPNHNRRQQREYITRKINNWIHEAIREWEANINLVDNTPDNREELAKVMYEQSFEEDRELAYVDHHMRALEEMTDEDFTTQWREYELPVVRGE